MCIWMSVHVYKYFAVHCYEFSGLHWFRQPPIQSRHRCFISPQTSRLFPLQWKHLSSQSLATIDQFSILILCLFRSITEKREHTTPGLLQLTSFTWHKSILTKCWWDGKNDTKMVKTGNQWIWETGNWRLINWFSLLSHVLGNVYNKRRFQILEKKHVFSGHI